MATLIRSLLGSLTQLKDKVFSSLLLLFQLFIIQLYKPSPPPKPDQSQSAGRARIAVIGAGLTGVSSAAHAVAHGFDVVLYEQEATVGGIWAHVNETSSLQLNGLLYRFHPAVLWSKSHPERDEILAEISRVWDEYHLESRTRFNTPVRSVRRVPGTGADPLEDPPYSQSRWIVNEGEDGEFDAVIVAVGTCGEPLRANFPGLPPLDDTRGRFKSGQRLDQDGDDDAQVFAGEVFHSSELDQARFEGKRVVVIGSGASGVEAVETALADGATGCVMVAREDKWIVPRNIVLDILLAAQPFGRDTPFTSLWQKLIGRLSYSSAPKLAPARTGLFDGIPICNSEFVETISSENCAYVRGDIVRFTKTGVRVKVRAQEDSPGEGKEVQDHYADIVVLATGFKRPQTNLFTDNLFPDNYDAIGTVGHFHIGIYTRILLLLLMDPQSRPTPQGMKLWVDSLRFLKSNRVEPGDALSFFTYMELVVWFLAFHLSRVSRLKWIVFTMLGWKAYPKAYKSG
ncbi:FAD/NAD-P-binding domain-containing protein [Trametes elegans]|nr:FAD/NAD-P-binding domain-containing protein [Trametes elegans]